MKHLLSMILIAACLTMASCGKKGDLDAPSFQGTGTGF